MTLSEFRTVYSYSPWKLLTPYGIAIVFATVSVLIGIVSVHGKGATYSHNLSTALRVGQGADIEINAGDLDGTDPLPGYLAETIVWLGKSKESRSSSSGYRSVASLNTPVDVPAVAKEPTVRSRLLSSTDGGDVHRSNTRITL